MPDWAVKVAIAVIAALSGLFAAWVAFQRVKYSRIRALEERVDLVEKRNVLLWNYNRQLVNHIYEGKGPPPPPLPEGIV